MFVFIMIKKRVTSVKKLVALKTFIIMKFGKYTYFFYLKHTSFHRK